MKKIIMITIIPALLFTFACKSDVSDKEKENEPFMVKQYARYATAVYQDAELKNRLTWLAKAEMVKKDTEKTFTNEKDQEVAFVELTDGQQGYLQLRHLADKPVIFIEDTRAHTRNNIASNVVGTIPAGSIGFIIDERADWVQIYVGNIDGTWITRHWVKDGYRSNDELLIDAKIYEDALSILSKDSPDSSDIEDAKEKLQELTLSNNIFAQLASDKLVAIADKKDDKKVELDKKDPVVEPGGPEDLTE